MNAKDQHDTWSVTTRFQVLIQKQKVELLWKTTWIFVVVMVLVAVKKWQWSVCWLPSQKLCGLRQQIRDKVKPHAQGANITCSRN
eukprot:m.368528 g.368528  ORF g.368528 m.368528 type:complete len:85 (-) comp45400_c0_seq1:77-331(-)